MSATRSGCRSATRPGTKNVARTSCRPSTSRICGTATFAPYVPCESTPGRSALAGSSPIQTSSASKSKVNDAAEPAPSGHIRIGTPFRNLCGGPGADPAPVPGSQAGQPVRDEDDYDQQEDPENGELGARMADQRGLHDG